MKINREIFRAYDIRGIVGEEINPQTAALIGKGYGTYIRRKGGKTITCGRDNRIAEYTSFKLQKPFIKGVLSTGCDVVQIGVSTSPLLYFTVAYWNMDGGVNVTGSHNPREYNGFKLTGKGGQPIASAEILEIRDIIENEEFAIGSGLLKSRDPKEDYFSVLSGKFHHLQKPIKVVVDAGNGVAGLFVPEMLRRIGCEVIKLYCTSNGNFPNHLPDPEMKENVVDLVKKVVANDANLGFAFDGDADRLGLVDEHGIRYESDYILILLARDLLQRHPGTRIMVDIKSSQNVIDDIKAHGGEPYLYKTGHSLIKLKMREEGILLAGELSGHMFFSEDYYGIDDALFAACRIAKIVSESGNQLSTHFANLPTLYASPEIRLKCPDEEKVGIVKEVTEFFKKKYDTLEIDGVRINFPEGWGLVRASNTGPNLTVRYEAKSEQAREKIARIIFEKLQTYPSIKDIPGKYLVSTPPIRNMSR